MELQNEVKRISYGHSPVKEREHQGGMRYLCKRFPDNVRKDPSYRVDTNEDSADNNLPLREKRKDKGIGAQTMTNRERSRSMSTATAAKSGKLQSVRKSNQQVDKIKACERKINKQIEALHRLKEEFYNLRNEDSASYSWDSIGIRARAAPVEHSIQHSPRG